MLVNLTIFTVILVLLLRLVSCKPRFQVSLDAHPDQNHQKPQNHQNLHHDLTNNEQSNIFPIDLRSINDYKLSDYLLISDIDGNLHNVDRNSGNLIWSLPFEESLVHIETNNSNSDSGKNDDSNILWFVEPYNDGSLYYFTPEFGLNKLPATIKELVLQSPFSLTGDDNIYTGTRKTSLYTINIHNGEIINQFGDDKCPTSSQQSDSLEDSDYIMIGKTVYELTIHSRTNSNIVWYVTYSQWGPNNLDNDLILQNQKSSDELYFTPFHDKSLLAINKDLGTPMWISRLPLLAVNVFDIFNNLKLNNNYVMLPHPLKVLNNLQINQDDGTINNDLCFINKTANSDQWFAMSFINYPTLIKSAPISQYQMSLFRSENNYVDMPNLDSLRNLKVNDPDSDHLINGIHKIHHLNSDTQYQPVSKFSKALDRPAIEGGGGDGRKSVADANDKQLIIQETTTNLDIPNIIEGIRFQSRSQNELLPTSPKEQEYLLIESTDKSEYLPEEDYDSRYSWEWVKRIIEDIFVVLMLTALLIFFPRTKVVYDKIVNFFSDFSFSLAIEMGSGKNKRLENENITTHNEISGTNSLISNNEKLNDLSDSTTKKVTIMPPSDFELVEGEYEEEQENVNEEVVKKKRKRGSRGGRRGNRKKHAETVTNETINNNHLDSTEGDQDHSSGSSSNTLISTTSLVKTQKHNRVQTKKLQIENNLVLSDKILGYGSHGTVVYQGTFENRPVAVKRMLLDFYDVANHEVSLLQQSDDHPNVIRYFCSQSSPSEKFLYIALELCQGSLDDLIERNKFTLKFKLDNASVTLNLNHLLYQLANGLDYLHNLKIVHRDIKPQNILIGDFKHKTAIANSNGSSITSIDEIRLLISDFGLCKRLDHDQSSFRATTQNAASGTSGWRAPELLLHHDLMEISPETISSTGSDTATNTVSSINSSTGGKRLTKAIDIFSLGCVFFYILTGGNHPFGDRYSREGNIIKGEYDLSLLNKYDDSVELKHLIGQMISQSPSHRPNTQQILKHPFFWSKGKKLEFLLKVSDRFEIERRDPPSDLLLQLEASAYKVTKGNWHKHFDEEFMNNLGKYRKYHQGKLMDLLRALRNKYHHFNDMPATLQQQMSPLPDQFYKYFDKKFPNLLMEIYFVIDKNLKHEHIFNEYY